MGEGPTYEVRPALSADAPALARGMNAAFVLDRSEDWVRWRLFDADDGSTDSLVVTADDEVVGHVGADVCDTWFHGRRCEVPSLGFLYVDEAHRGTEAAKLLARAMYAHRDQERLSFPMSDTAAGRVVGTHDRTKMTQWVRWHTGASLARTSLVSRRARLATLVRPPASLLVFALRSRARRRGEEVEVVDGLASGDDHDDLASRSRGFVPAIRIRDARYVERWWRTNPEPIGHAHSRLPDGTLGGHVAWRTDPVRWRGQIVDLLTGSADHASALVAYAAERLRQHGHDMVVFDQLDPRPEMARAMRRAGFVARGIGTRVLVHPGPPPNLGSTTRDWMLTLSDTDYV